MGFIWKSLGRLLGIVRDNLINLVTVALALYVLIRGQRTGYQTTDIPFLLSVVVGLLGLNAVDGLIERKMRLDQIGTGIGTANSAIDQAKDDLVAVRADLDRIQLALSALRSGAGATQLLSEEPEIPRDLFRRARRIYWSGVTLRTSLRQRLGDLGFALEHGVDLSLLMADPASKELKTELTLREGAKYEYLEGVFKSTQLNLQILAQHLSRGESFQLGFHPVYPTYGLTIFNPDEDDGVCYVELYHASRQRGASFVVHATADGQWFHFFVEQFSSLMARARIYTITSPEDVEHAITGESARDV